MTPPRPRPSGVTLVELLVALAVGSIVIGAAVAVLVAQQRAFAATSDDRLLQDSARVALEEITGNLRLAGYGVDPPLAFDLGPMATFPMGRAPRGAVTGHQSYRCDVPVACRDSATGPDELVFYARDPAFGHRLAAPATTSQLTLAGPLATPIRRGQVLQVICYTGNLLWSYVTAGGDVPATGAALVNVPLEGGQFDFPFQNEILRDACFAGAEVRVFKVDRFRYYVDTFAPDGSRQPWQSPAGRPFLVLDQGLLDDAGQPIRTAVAPDVEDLQVTYLFPAAVAPALPAVPPPTLQGTALAEGPGGIELAPATGAPSYAAARTAPSRLNNHPANVRAVRVALVVRTAAPSPTPLPLDQSLLPVAGNRPATPGQPGYRRLLFEATTAARNMESRAPYFPSLSGSAGSDQLNVGGG
jgi:type IV pilus assembly protein PilW